VSIKVSKNAAAQSRLVRRPKTTVQLHIAHGHGHLEFARENASAVRHLQVHQRPVPVLQTEHATLAELTPAQPVVQRLFRENPANAGQTGQRCLLGSAPGRSGHVRERFAITAPQTVQAGQVRQGQVRKVYNILLLN